MPGTRAGAAGPGARVRMTGGERREQLIEVARELFAERGFAASSVEEVAQRGGVSKPVVYEHFGGKEGLYAVVVDRETRRLLDRFATALADPPVSSAGAELGVRSVPAPPVFPADAELGARSVPAPPVFPADAELGVRSVPAPPGSHPRELLRRAASAFLGYVDEHTSGFRVLVRDTPPTGGSGMFSSLLGDIAGQVEHVLARELARHGMDPATAPLYSQALVGMVAQVGQWWLEERRPGRDEVTAHLVNLAWFGLSRMGEEHPPTE